MFQEQDEKIEDLLERTHHSQNIPAASRLGLISHLKLKASEEQAEPTGPPACPPILEHLYVQVPTLSEVEASSVDCISKSVREWYMDAKEGVV